MLKNEKKWLMRSPILVVPNGHRAAWKGAGQHGYFGEGEARRGSGTCRKSSLILSLGARSKVDLMRHLGRGDFLVAQRGYNLVSKRWLMDIKKQTVVVVVTLGLGHARQRFIEIRLSSTYGVIVWSVKERRKGECKIKTLTMRFS